jgi:GNAT superfamily N-acetyltransferase
VRDREDSLARRGREPRVTAALRGGEVAAFTELVVEPAPARKAATDDTAAVAEHRGRGLGRAVKSESLRLLRRERPDVEVVTTLNAEDNGPMRAINTKLGFVPVVTLTTAVLRPA